MVSADLEFIRLFDVIDLAMFGACVGFCAYIAVRLFRRPSSR
jgi:hypothetical protein